MKIVPVNSPGDHRSCGVSSDYTVEEITKILGFPPNVKDDPFKVKNSWGFKVDGVQCGIWVYKGSRWSFFGPREIAEKLFPEK